MRKLIFLPMLALALAGAVWAQGDRGTITGTVTDQQNAVLPGAKVTAKHSATNAQRSTVATSTGSYTLASTTAGRHLSD